VPTPTRLAMTERPAEGDGTDRGDLPLVVFVHGSLDRGSSFARVWRRLPDLNVVTYDRRGYNGSRDVLPVATGLQEHVDDLVEVVDGRRAVVVGHSYGGNVALAAALDERGTSISALAAYEPPQPWLPNGSRNPTATSTRWDEEEPAVAAERFFRRMVSDRAWDRLTEEEKADRRGDGVALAAELGAIRLAEAPFDVGALRIPVIYGRGEESLPHHRRAVAWLVEHTPGAELFEIPGARHGAHLTHPDAFAAMVRRAVARAGKPSPSPARP
jgi:pimeloyl-ACP methyl ester carboxylesterase